MSDKPKRNAIAIIGVAFRFPCDLADEIDFWGALKERKNLITETPDDRWAKSELLHTKRMEPGRSITFSAGILSRIDEFDAEFFGISPREAAWLDPQQRLLLELSWEVMENAGVLPSSLAGTNCGVYVGISSLDYGTRGLDDLAAMSSHSMTGNALSIAANRLSYFFDLRGPSLAIDTACSSSLVALHHACLALQSGEAPMALVGGVNLLLHPYPFVGFTKASMLSADGRCKTFDASGNGYVRAEGGAVLLLKPLDRAVADGDEIRAVILSSGINADGARKTGITIPSREGQAELMRAVLAKSGLSARDVDFIEAHGTGTAVGDPIECAAIGEVYGQGRYKPLPIGSVKANLGHMEAASGMAGLVKAILALQQRALPPQIHLDTPNPRIDFRQLNLEPVTEYHEFAKAGLLVAGVNSFGFGGANAHVLIQEYPRATFETAPPTVNALPPLFLSARADRALRELASRYSARIQNCTATDYYDIAYAAAYRRDRLEKRLALHAGSPYDAAEKLAAYARGQTVDGVVVEERLPESGGIAFVYSGNGAQWAGMGLRLVAESTEFAEIFAELDARMQPVAGFSLLAELHADGETSRLNDTVVAQPLLFAIQVALTRLLKTQGIEPQAVAGHSVGEVAAAWASGALDLDAAIRLIVARSRAQGKTRGTGRMAAAGISEEAMRAIMAELGVALDVAIAGVNSPKNITLSGRLGDLERIQAYVASRGIFFRLLDLDYAFHSRHMEPIKGLLLASLSRLEANSERCATFISTVTGSVLDHKELATAEYWWRNVREPVRFSEAIAELARLGCRVFIEIGPHAILQRYMGECLADRKIRGRVLPALRKEADGLVNIVETALRAHLLAEQPNLHVYFPAQGRRVRLPNYPWQRERHWHPHTSESLLSLERRRVHPLLGWRLPEAAYAWENVLDTAILPWLADHKVGGAIVFPGAAYAEMALAAAREWLGGERLAFEELDIVAPMLFDGEHARTLRLEINPRDGGFSIRSRQRLSTDEWTLHAVGRILQATSAAVTSRIHQPTAGNHLDREIHYRLTNALGLEYGENFRGLREAAVARDVLQAEVESPSALTNDGYLIHPALLDVCFQSLVGFFRSEIETGQGMAFLPVKLGKLERYRRGAVSRFRARLVRRSARSVLASFELFDDEGELLASLTACRFRAAPLAQKEQEKVARWRNVLSLRPHPADERIADLPSSQEIIEEFRSALDGLGESRRRWFREALPLFEALVLSFAFEAFRQAEQSGPDELSRLATSPDPYTRWLSGLLKQEGLMSDLDGRWTMQADAALPPAEDIWRSLVREHPACLPQLVLIGRVGRHLSRLLCDTASRREFVDALWGTSAAETLHDDDPVYAGMSRAIESVLSRLAKALPAHRRLRVLEIAMGPSELPRVLIHALPEERLEYALAVPKTVAERQQAEFARHPSITLAPFDSATWRWAEGSKMPDCFDVVIVRHALHRAANPKAAINQIGRWLASNGCLIVAERYPDWNADFLGGLEEGWWHGIANADTPQSALLPPAAWVAAVEQEGFDAVHHLAEPAADGIAEGAYLIVARRPMQNAIASPVPEAGKWLFLVDASSAEWAAHLAIRLEFQGQQVVTAETMSGLKPADFDHVVHLRGWGIPVESSAAFLAEALDVVKALAADRGRVPRLWFVTRGGALASPPPTASAPSPSQASLWGLGRVVMNECPALECTLIDLACELRAPDTLSRLENELLHPDGANEIVLADPARYAVLLREEKDTHTSPASEGERFQLNFHLPGQLRNLRWLPQGTHPLRDDEVEVEVRATGLNFRDVMYLMGMLPDEAVEKGFAGASLGLEFAGVVTRVGPRVSHFEAGDKVMGFGSSCFASHVVTRADAIAPMPDEWSFEAAATVPTVFFTVYYALTHLAGLHQGERVLIHGAAGGVGIAAIQLARYLGAEVFATAGSDEKRDFVHLLGGDHIFDSRSLSFADEIISMTNGEGVDVVLNSLAGEAMRRSIAVLRPFGRFLELGKRDFFENTPLGLRPFKDNISYFGIDADQLLTGRPQLAARLFREVMALFREGALSPLPCRVFAAERVVDAFRVMQQARHIGKVVVSLDGARPPIERPQKERAYPALPKDSTWIVTGGLSGFGLESARWLAAHGVGHLVLVGRRGLGTPGAKEAIEALSAQGARVEAIACDIADSCAVSDLIDRVRKTLPPLKGILHAAAVFDDALLNNLDAERIEAVVAPKLLGAWNLHQATIDIPLDHFVLYSSIATVIGNPGQANYVAANAGMEGLAALRRAHGLPAVCIGWGPIGDTGYLARNQAVKDSLAQRLGKPPLSARLALSQLDHVLTGNDTVAVANFDWNMLARLLPSSPVPRFAELNRHLKGVDPGKGEMDIRALIVGKAQEEIITFVQELVIREVAQILAIAPERIDPTRSLHELGMDSLMAVELALSLEQRFGLQLPAMMLSESPSVEKVTSRIVKKLLGDEEGKEEHRTPDMLDEAARQLARQHGEALDEEEQQGILEGARAIALSGTRLTE